MPGTMKPVNQKANPGLAKLPTNVRNKMGYMQKGGKATKKYAKGGMGSEDEFVFDEDMLAEQAKKPTYAEMTKLDERDKREMAIQKRVREKAQAEPKTRGEAFKKARAAGKKVFEYPKGSGKMFTTETVEEKVKRLAKKKERRNQTDTGAADYSSKKKEPAKKRDMKNFSKMSFSEQMEYLRTQGKENMGAKTRAAKGGMMQKYNVGGMVKANCGASVKPSGGSRNK